VIVIPAHLADEVALEARDMTAYEEFVLEKVKSGTSIIGLYPATDDSNLADFERWRSERKRMAITEL